MNMSWINVPYRYRYRYRPRAARISWPLRYCTRFCGPYPYVPPSCWRARRYPSAQLLAWPRVHDNRALSCPAPCRAPDPQRSHRSYCAWARSRASQSIRLTPAIYRRSTHSALPARLPSSADYILRLQDTEPESLEIMLRLLIIALPLIVALPAAFDEEEVNVLQFEAQSPLQFGVRSPPEPRLFSLFSQPPREIK